MVCGIVKADDRSTITDVSDASAGSSCAIRWNSGLDACANCNCFPRIAASCPNRVIREDPPGARSKASPRFSRSGENSLNPPVTTPAAAPACSVLAVPRAAVCAASWLIPPVFINKVVRVSSGNR